MSNISIAHRSEANAATTACPQSIRRRRATLAALIVGIFASLLTVASPASATAKSCTGYGWIVGTYRSQFCAQTIGSGNYVSTVGAGYSAPIGWTGVLCDTRLKVEFVDTYGRVYKTLYSSLQGGCSTIGAWKFGVYGTVRYGHINYVLLSRGAQVALVRHQIK